MGSRYYFHLLNCTASIRDQDGIDLEDVDHVLIYAYAAIEELRGEDPAAGADWQGWRMEIVDGSGRAVHSIPLDDFDPERDHRN